MNVALFSTCIVDTIKPEIGFATLKLLKAAGCKVSVPSQSCCGQVNYNNGDLNSAEQMARQWLSTFAGFDYVVIPSGSCAAMLKRHSPSLFSGEPMFQNQFQALADKTFELSEFLTSVVEPKFGAIEGQLVCYHDSCSGLRELGIKAQPRGLLSNFKAIELVELENAEACCGFGGTFCIKHTEISCKLADDKIAEIERVKAQTLIGGDWGCLMHLQARLKCVGKDKDIAVMHLSEFLAQSLS